MKEGMDRREFLKATAATCTVLLTSNLLQGTARAQGSIRIPEAEKIVITIVTDNYADATRPDYKIAKRQPYGSNPLERSLHGEHGLSYHIETVVNGEPHSCLFDIS